MSEPAHGERRLQILIAQGDSIVDDIHSVLDNRKRTTSVHIDDVTAWHQRARNIIKETDPSLLDQAREFSALDHTDVILSRLASTLMILRALATIAQGDVKVKTEDAASPLPRGKPSNSVFIVHGHDEGMKLAVARFVERIGLKPVILHEQTNNGRTIIEKFEKHASDVGFAVVLMSPDDIGYARGKPEDAKARARQNVIIELGYFAGALGRSRVCVLVSDKIEIPSDYIGVVYQRFDAEEGWKLALAKELASVGYEIPVKALLAS